MDGLPIRFVFFFFFSDSAIKGKGLRSYCLGGEGSYVKRAVIVTNFCIGLGLRGGRRGQISCETRRGAQGG